MVENLHKTDIFLAVLIIFGVGAYLGASYADNNWKADLKYLSESGVRFNFDNSGHFYLIQEHNFSELKFNKTMDYTNISVIYP